ncbi:7995_t:CDS:2, partial [Scutellospora calospora]
VRIFETGYNSDPKLYNGEYFSSDSEIVKKSLTNIFLEVKHCDDNNDEEDDNISEPMNNDNYVNIVKSKSNCEFEKASQLVNVPKPKYTISKPKYVLHDIAQELLSSLCLYPLKGNKWLWNGYNICNIFQDDKIIKTPLSIGVVNFHNILCIESLPSTLITHIQEQMEDEDVDTISFDDTKKFGINKLAIDIDEEIIKYLNMFQDC